MLVSEFLNNFSKEKLENIYSDPNAAFYLINKAKGQHSFKIVSSLRQLLGIKKVGFAGTLDPLASGLMILATGSATKLLDLFHLLPKTYQASIIFGKTSASFDLEQTIVVNPDAKEFSRADLDKYLDSFLGKQEQTVPIYSAKKVAGKKLHKLARLGQTIENLPKNKIEIYSLKVLAFSYPNLDLEISCSAGTYIRSLVSDLGELSGNGAVMSDLKRTQIGPYQLAGAIDMPDLSLSKIKEQALNVRDGLASLSKF